MAVTHLTLRAPIYPNRTAVGARERLGVHLPGEQDLRRHRLTQWNRAAVRLDGSRFPGDVRGFEGDMQPLALLHSGSRKDVSQPNTAPLRG